PDGPQRLQRLGRRELLAHEGAHDAPAAKLAAHLEPAVHAQEIPPRRRLRLARDEITEHDAVSTDILACPGFEDFVGGWRRGRFEEGPASRADGRMERPPASAALTPALVRVQQAPEPGEAISGHQTGRDELAQRFFDLDPEAAHARGHVVHEGRADL